MNLRILRALIAPALMAVPPLRAAVTVTQDKILWFLCGEANIGDVPTRVTLTINGADARKYRWLVTEGKDFVQFSNSSEKIDTVGPKAEILSKAASKAAKDVTVRVIYSNVDSVDYKLTVREPRSLKKGDVKNSPAISTSGVAGCTIVGPGQASTGYRTDLAYTILDQFGDVADKMPINETLGQDVDKVQNNWTVSPPTGVPGSADGTFSDQVSLCGNTWRPQPVKPPQNLSKREIDRIPQAWFAGSQIIGRGCKVQTDDIVRFIDHAEHQNIKSPPQ